MKWKSFDINGPILFQPQAIEDPRGKFVELYNSGKTSDAQIPEFVQENLSVSHENVFRGFHWQTPPMAQGKLVTCLTGAILDFAIDIRRSSPHFGKVTNVKLESRDFESLWLPPGFAHGFLAIEDGTTVLYRVTNFWSKEHEAGICPYEFQELVPAEAIVSAKDLLAPKLDEVQSEKLFP